MFSVVVVVYSEEVEDVFQLDVMTYLMRTDDFRGERRLEGFCRMVQMARESDGESLRELRKLVHQKEERVEGYFEGNRGHVYSAFGRGVYIALHCCLYVTMIEVLNTDWCDASLTLSTFLWFWGFRRRAEKVQFLAG
jgi:hypothetical protein